MATASRFTRATKRQSRLRLALAGPSGSGKTFTALAVGTALAGDGGVALVDTERGSASKYSDRFAFDVLELESFHPERYIEAIRDAEQAGYAVLILDSLSHAWMGKDGALELVDRAAKRQQSGNTFGAWREVTPLHNHLVDAIVGARLHVVLTLRSKQDYVQEKDERTGRTVVRKVGMAPVFRDGVEYEVDVFGDLDHENTLVISKTRCPALAGTVIPKPGADLARTLLAWLSDGAPLVEKPFDKELSDAMEAWQQAVDEANERGMALPKAPPLTSTAEDYANYTTWLRGKIAQHDKRQPAEAVS